jgi:hypothetical protein
MGERKSKKGLVILLVILFIIIGIPLLSVGLSFVGRITPESVIPDNFTAYINVPNPVDFADRILAHESLPEILAEPSFASFLPAVNSLTEKKIFANKSVRFMGRGSLDAALMDEGKILAAWDMGILSPLLRFLPNIAGRITIPNLYYVQAGKLSRLEYRMEDGSVFFISPYKNLLIISNETILFESVLNGTSRDGDLRASVHKTFSARDFDLGLLIDSAPLLKTMTNTDPAINAVMNQIDFPGLIEVTVSVLPKQLDISIISPLSSSNDLLDSLLSNDSQTSRLLPHLPESTQYSTLISLGDFKEMLNYSLSIMDSSLTKTLDTADSSSKLLLGMPLDELLFSWMGREAAVIGLEGRPFPIFALEIKDEQKRKEVFDQAFSSLVLNEDISNVIDGTRIPQIEIPPFLSGIISAFGITVPALSYTVQEDFLFISESPENLLAVINSIRKNTSLPKTDLWKTLAKSSSDQNSISLFYSLDRSLPFFLKGNTNISNILRLYRHGLARFALEDKNLTISLSVIPGLGKGISPVIGYPIDMNGKMGNILYSVNGPARNESRIFFTGETCAFSLDPANNTLYELSENGTLYVIPSQGLPLASLDDPAAWIVSNNGTVNLVNGNMEVLDGFPIVSGGRLSSAPSAFDGKIYLPDQDGSVYVVDRNGTISQMNLRFENSLKSPPNFLTADKKNYAGFYDKGFLGALLLTDIDGTPYPGWPLPLMNIAFGTPAVFSAENKVHAAFITQAGELSVFDETGIPLQGFPLNLSGVFYIQGVFDGEYLWLIAENGTLYRVSLSGEVLSQKISGLNAAEEAHLQVVDVDNEKIPEIFITGEGNSLFGYSRDFNSLEGFPLSVWGKPAFGDFNGDKKIECIGMGLDNKLYRWQFN